MAEELLFSERFMGRILGKLRVLMKQVVVVNPPPSVPAAYKPGVEDAGWEQYKLIKRINLHINNLLVS